MLCEADELPHHKCRKIFWEKQHSQGYCAIQHTAMVKKSTANLLVVCKYKQDNLYVQHLLCV